MKRFTISLILTAIIITTFVVSASAKSALLFFDTVTDISTLDETARNEILKKVVILAEEETKNRETTLFAPQSSSDNVVHSDMTLKELFSSLNKQ